MKLPNTDRRSGHRRGSTQISATLARVDFPKAKEDLADLVGETEIEILPGRTLPLERMVERIERERFYDMTEAQNLLDAKWEEYVQMARGESPGPAASREPGETEAAG